MDPLGATASCIAILQILRTARSLFDTSHNALKDINSIMSEVDGLKCILNLLEKQEYKSDIVVQTVASCKGDLDTLHQKLEKISLSCNSKKRLKWIFIKEDVTEALHTVRGMRENLLLAMTASQSIVLTDLHQQMVLSNTCYQQHHVGSSTGQLELFSSINNTIVPQLSALRDYSTNPNSLRPGYSRRLPIFTATGTQKQVFRFVFFDILVRTNDLRQYGGSSKDKKQLRQAWSILLRFMPSPILAWLVETVIVLELSWGSTVDGLKINPRFYVRVPDSHQVMKAARTGSIALVHELISNNSAAALCMTSAGWTPLHFAAAKGHLGMCDFLISHGADLNAVGYIGMTPLHAAATFGQVEVMKLLITKGSDPNLFHDHGFHAIFQLFITANFLAGEEKLAVVDWIMRKQEIFAFDVHAVDVLGRDLAQLIIKAKMDPSVTGNVQQTGLVDALLTENLCLDNQDFEGSTALHEATKVGRLDIVEQLANAFAKPTLKDHRGRTPIHYAASLGNLAIVRQLLGKDNAGINDSDVAGWTPLRLAVKGHHLNMVKLLIDLGAHCDDALLNDAARNDAKDVFDYFMSIGLKPDSEILWDTITNPDLHYLRGCVLAGANPNSMSGYYTPLAYAVIHSQASAVQLLLSMDADVNLRTDDGESALLLAVQRGEPAMVDILLRARAATHDLSFKESPTINLITLATYSGYTCIAEMLWKAGAPKPAADQMRADSNFDMVAAAKRNRVDILTELMRKIGDISMIQDEMYSAFLYACRHKKSEAAIFLINANLDLHAERHYPPLCWAVGAGLNNVVQVLLDKGADKDQVDCAGRTALSYVLYLTGSNAWTTEDKFAWMTEQLIPTGININAVDKEGYTVLGMACSYGLTRIVKALLEAGADISIQSREDHQERFYIHARDDARSETGKRYLPLELAAKAGHEDIVQLLLAKGADWRSLRQQKAIATSHTVLVRHWFADDGNTDDEEIIFLGCEPPEAQLGASCPQVYSQEPHNHNKRQKAQSSKPQTHKAKLLRQFVHSGLFILDGLKHIESYFLHLCVGMAAITVVSLLLLHHKVPLSLLQRNQTLLRVLLWAFILTWAWKAISA